MSTEIQHYGNAGHLCVSRYCQFHLCTSILRDDAHVLISTVGEYLPGEYDYMRKLGYEDIGMNRKYETMVFTAGEPCECGCGMPETNGHEIDFDAYNDAQSANAGHARIVKKWLTEIMGDDGE